MNDERISGFPYANIIVDLVDSIVNAQAILTRHLIDGGSLRNPPHQKINDCFTWLSLRRREGEDRHLVHGFQDTFPLATKEQRLKSGVSKIIFERVERREDYFLNLASEASAELALALRKCVRQGPTRISRILVMSFDGLDTTISDEQPQGYTKTVQQTNSSLAGMDDQDSELPDNLNNDLTEASSKRKTHRTGYNIVSPLSIALDYLTVPESIGSRGYSLTAVKNFLFAAHDLVPDYDGQSKAGTFSVADVESAISVILTSTGDRYLSRGQDKLPSAKARSASQLVRHYLAARRFLTWHFGSIQECNTYLRGGTFLSRAKANFAHASLEFSKNPHLERIPEFGQIINELWGLALPIRGADVLFRGGLKFSSRGGLVVAIHGGPGSGKTSLALAFSAYLAPMGVRTLYISAEEGADDLQERVSSLVPDSIRRLAFFEPYRRDNIDFVTIDLMTESDENKLNPLDQIEQELRFLELALEQRESIDFGHASGILPSPCRALIVLDGLHDFFAIQPAAGGGDHAQQQSDRLYRLIERLRRLKALVIVTTAEHWLGQPAIDYLVDVAVKLTFESVGAFDSKPDRRIQLSKARHQLCAAGTHGLQIGGEKGARFSPQISYQLEGRSIWKSKLPNKYIARCTLGRVLSTKLLIQQVHEAIPVKFEATHWHSIQFADIFDGAQIFLNGQGSGGKAGLALKIAMSPIFERRNGTIRSIIHSRQRILVVSFLYPRDYYEHLYGKLRDLVFLEYQTKGFQRDDLARLEVMQLYPGHLRPNDLYNRIEWELDAAEMNGDPYTCVVIDGLHNIFLQFPEIEKYKLFWPQIYNSLRSRIVTVITTHTTLQMPGGSGAGPRQNQLDDNRSEPLRHALVQKMDFQLEIDRIQRKISTESDLGFGNIDHLSLALGVSPKMISASANDRISSLFTIRVLSAIEQRLPTAALLWDRENLVLYQYPSSSGGSNQIQLDLSLFPQ